MLKLAEYQVDQVMVIMKQDDLRHSLRNVIYADTGPANAVDDPSKHDVLRCWKNFVYSDPDARYSNLMVWICTCQ